MRKIFGFVSLIILAFLSIFMVAGSVYAIEARRTAESVMNENFSFETYDEVYDMDEEEDEIEEDIYNEIDPDMEIEPETDDEDIE